DFSAERKTVLVTFYERWCPHSAELMPMLTRAAAVLSTRAFLMRAECSASTRTRAFCTRNEVHAYPTIMLFTGEDKVRYNDVRQVSSIEAFIQQHWVQPAPAPASSAPHTDVPEVAGGKDGQCECAPDAAQPAKKGKGKTRSKEPDSANTNTSSLAASKGKKEKGAKVTATAAKSSKAASKKDAEGTLAECQEVVQELQSQSQECEARLHQLEESTQRCHLATLH
ncbi:hypothetical protein CYMTET_33361, partial [Cymbomonas tetramitiformis]